MRFISIDFLRGIAAFGIVGCHLSLMPRTDGGALVTSLCDFNVGLFAALAGVLMSGVKESRGSFRRYEYGRLSFASIGNTRIVGSYNAADRSAIFGECCWW